MDVSIVKHHYGTELLKSSPVTLKMWNCLADKRQLFVCILEEWPIKTHLFNVGFPLENDWFELYEFLRYLFSFWNNNACFIWCVINSTLLSSAAYLILYLLVFFCYLCRAYELPWTIQKRKHFHMSLSLGCLRGNI